MIELSFITISVQILLSLQQVNLCTVYIKMYRVRRWNRFFDPMKKKNWCNVTERSEGCEENFWNLKYLQFAVNSRVIIKIYLWIIRLVSFHNTGPNVKKKLHTNYRSKSNNIALINSVVIFFNIWIIYLVIDSKITKNYGQF